MDDRETTERLSPGILELLAKALTVAGEAPTTILEQAKAARVADYSPTMIDVVVPDDCPTSSLPNGPTPGRSFVYSRTGQPIGEVLVWVRAGRLIGLEQAWVTDQPPTSWPHASELHVEASRTGDESVD